MPEKKQSDQKMAALMEHTCLNPRPERVVDTLFCDEAFFDSRDLVQVKYEMLRKVSVGKRSVTQTAQCFGFSRPSFYEAKAAFDKNGLMGLVPKKRGPRGRHKVSEAVLNFVEDILKQEEQISTVQVANRVEAHLGVKLHPRSIERALKAKKKLL